MVYTFIIGWAIWLTGVFIAWNQLRVWGRRDTVSIQEHDPAIVLFSLLSWLLYPIYAMAWMFNRLKRR